MPSAAYSALSSRDEKCDSVSGINKHQMVEEKGFGQNMETALKLRLRKKLGLVLHSGFAGFMKSM
jgi:hypothetical protein